MSHKNYRPRHAIPHGSYELWRAWIEALKSEDGAR